MTKAEYLQRAKDCEELAKLVITDEARQKILKIAAGWRELADPPESRVASRAA
jgi:hypothetical protein